MDARRHIHALRKVIDAVQPAVPASAESRFALGANGPDRALGGGLQRGALHEIIAAGQPDAAAAAGFCAGLCISATRRAPGAGARAPAAARRHGVVWIRQVYGEMESGKLYPHGLREMGMPPGRLIHIRLKDATEILRAGMEAIGCKALGAVVVEIPGSPKILDLTATRRLSLAAEKSGVPVFLLRICPQAEGSAATTRWQIRSAPSRALEANAPGLAAFDIALLRHRAGSAGQRWRLEWDRDAQLFREPALSRPVVSLSPDRPAASSGKEEWRRAG